MQRFKARVTRDPDGGFIAAAVELPNCWSRSRDRDEALAKLGQEIRYRIEYCPCTGVTDDFVQVDVVAESGDTRSAEPPIATAPAPGEIATWRGVAGCPGGPRPASPTTTTRDSPRRHTSRWSD